MLVQYLSTHYSIFKAYHLISKELALLLLSQCPYFLQFLDILMNLGVRRNATQHVSNYQNQKTSPDYPKHDPQ